MLFHLDTICRANDNASPATDTRLWFLCKGRFSDAGISSIGKRYGAGSDQFLTSPHTKAATDTTVAVGRKTRSGYSQFSGQSLEAQGVWSLGQNHFHNQPARFYNLRGISLYFKAFGNRQSTGSNQAGLFSPNQFNQAKAAAIRRKVLVVTEMEFRSVIKRNLLFWPSSA